MSESGAHDLVDPAMLVGILDSVKANNDSIWWYSYSITLLVVKITVVLELKETFGSCEQK